jgi:hypothetical protein
MHITHTEMGRVKEADARGQTRHFPANQELQAKI